MSPAIPSNQKSYRRDLLVSLLMVACIVGAWGFLIAGSIARSSGERQFPSLAHASLFGYSFTTAILLVAPFIGGCSALRLVRSAARTGFPAVVGWLLLALFALVLFFSGMVCWLDYHRYARA